jgi:hypothetical protein
MRLSSSTPYVTTNGVSAYLDTQIDEVTQGFAEVQWNPFQPGVDVPDSLRDHCKARLRPGACQQFSGPVAA